MQKNKGLTQQVSPLSYVLVFVLNKLGTAFNKIAKCFAFKHVVGK